MTLRGRGVELVLGQSPAAARIGLGISSVVAVSYPFTVTEENPVNPVRLLTALRPVFENPPAQAVEATAFRRPVDVRRALFASASRPSSGWGA
ncbi:hypothetical protein [Streptomyces venezuelae]|uniref:hypothetical protein n=1 Tax=Streptomyces venezuelae TaxID=54571 RepID=UPI00366329B4